MKPSTTDTAKPAAIRSALVACALIAATIAAYGPALQGGFIWDDNDHVTHNTAVQNPSGPADIWRRLGATPQYYPLVFTSFWIEHALWGLNPFGYHLNNVLLHLLNAFLLWRVLLRLSIPAAWLAAAVFALHPLQVESAAWITERKNILSAVFYLGALLAYLRFARIGPPARSAAAGWRCYALALLLFVAALLSKTVTCSLPAVILLLLWWKRGRVSWRAFVPLVPMLAIGVGMGLMTVWIEKSHIGATGSEWDLSWVERTLIAGRALWFYLGKLVWPADLMFWYPRWRIDVGEWQQFIYPAAFAGLTAALWISRRRIGRAPIVSLLIFSGTLLPALGFFDVYPMRFSFVADHFQYLACIAPIALLTAGAARAFARGRMRAAGCGVAVLLLITLATLTWKQAAVYSD
ncbi:MAG: O-GlcNAc transferase, partial [Planctomycetes bacterium]|nr:O-GlcNAc transferase [Planctomycetota bacterium]